VAQLTGERESAGPWIGHEFVKRSIDVVLSLALILILTPMFLVLCLLVWSTSAGPTIFRQQRLGLHKKPFVMLKLRTMYVDNDDRIHREYVTKMLSVDNESAVTDNGIYKLDPDPRITPVGAWLRRTSLDELPQLINVLRGDMSLVGPRPMLPWEVELLNEPYQQRFGVKPGITGLWQVSGRSLLSVRSALELDVEYVLRRSLGRDLVILVRTAPAIFRGGAR
jgi:lipopolysaccharide/colanic/teichoic acid biosynthesis glycosyltransferase